MSERTYYKTSQSGYWYHIAILSMELDGEKCVERKIIGTFFCVTVIFVFISYKGWNFKKGVTNLYMDIVDLGESMWQKLLNYSLSISSFSGMPSYECFLLKMVCVLQKADFRHIKFT